MGLSLEEYAVMHPQKEPESERMEMDQTATIIRNQREETEQANQMKAAILQQLQQGDAPENVLYTALRCIGQLSHDTVFSDTCLASLDAIYSDLAQQSFIADNAAIAARRLEDRKREANRKLKINLARQLSAYSQITKALSAALEAVNSAEKIE